MVELGPQQRDFPSLRLAKFSRDGELFECCKDQRFRVPKSARTEFTVKERLRFCIEIDDHALLWLLCYLGVVLSLAQVTSHHPEYGLPSRPFLSLRLWTSKIPGSDWFTLRDGSSNSIFQFWL